MFETIFSVPKIFNKKMSRMAFMLLSSAFLFQSLSWAEAKPEFFESPSNNIQCASGADERGQWVVECTILEKQGRPPLPNPVFCSSSAWGHTFRLYETGPAQMMCGFLQNNNKNAQTIRYGGGVNVGSINCTSRKIGFECINSNGNGFFLSRRSQSAFNSVVASENSFEQALSVQNQALANRQIVILQERLAATGFYKGEVDGEAGPMTRDAISRLQGFLGNPVTGEMGQQDYSGLELMLTGGSPSPGVGNVLASSSQESASKNSNTKTDGAEIVTMLKGLGFSNTDQMTSDPEVFKAIVLAFQKRYQLPQTGDMASADMAVLRAIYQAIISQQSIASAPVDKAIIAQGQTEQKQNVSVTNATNAASNVASASHILETNFPRHEVPQHKGYSLFYEPNTVNRGAEDTMPKEAWTNWYLQMVPRAVPSILEVSDATTLFLANLFLPQKNKAEIEQELNLGFPLFLDEQPFIDSAKNSVGKQREDHSIALQIRARNSKFSKHADNVYRRQINEFDREFASKLIRSELANFLSTKPSKLPLKTVQVSQAFLGEYDFDIQAFQVKTVGRLDLARGNNTTNNNSWHPSFAANAIGSSSTFQFRFETDGGEYPIRLPMSHDAARELAYKTEGGNTRQGRRIYLATFGQITDVESTLVKRGEVGGRDRGKFEGVIKYEVEKFEFWLDPEGKEILHTVELKDGNVLGHTDAAKAESNQKPISLYSPEFSLSLAFSDFNRDEFSIQNYSNYLSEKIQRRMEFEELDLSKYGLTNVHNQPTLRYELKQGRIRPQESDVVAYADRMFKAAQSGLPNQLLVPFGLGVFQGRTLSDPLNQTPMIQLVFNRINKLLDSGTAKVEFSGSSLEITMSKGRKSRLDTIEYILSLSKRDIELVEKLELPDEVKNIYNPKVSTRNYIPLAGDSQIEGLAMGHLVLELVDNEKGFNEEVVRQGGRSITKKRITGRPVKIVFAVNGKTIEMPVPSEESVSSIETAASIPPVQEYTADTVLVLNAEISDLLMVKHAPELLSNADFIRMMLARWEYEQGFQDVNSTPEGGRFFDFGFPRPAGPVVPSIAEQYRAWAEKRAASLPKQYVLYPIPIAERREEEPRRIGRTFIRPYDVDRSIRNCGYKLKSANSGIGVFAQLQPEISMACDHLKSAASNGNDPIFLGNTETLLQNSDNREKRQKSGNLYASVGLRVTCPNRDRYCEANRKALRSEDMATHINGSDLFLDDAYRLDKQVDLTPEILESVKEHQRNRLRAYGVVVEINDIRRDQTLPLPTFVAAANQVKSFIQKITFGNEFGSDNGDDIVGKSWSDPSTFKTSPVNIFDLKVLSAGIYEGENRRAVMDLPLRNLSAKPDPKVLRKTEKALQPPPSEPTGPDIVGLRIGMSFEEADEVIRRHMDVKYKFAANRTTQEPMGVENIMPFNSGFFYQSEDGTDRIAIFDEPPSASGVVLAITRSKTWQKGQVSPETVFTSLTDKYGTPKKTWDNDGSIWWLEDNSGCSNSTHVNSSNRIWNSEDVKTSGWNANEKGHYFIRLPDHYQANQMGIGANCKPGVFAQFGQGQDSNWDRLFQRIYDKSLYRTHFFQSQQITKEAQAGDVDNSSKSEKPEVKL